MLHGQALYGSCYLKEDHLTVLEGKKNKDPLAVFSKLFHVYHAKLHRYAFTILKDNDTAEDIVQTVFINLWERMDHLQLEDAIGSYLYKSTYNRCLNHIRNDKTREQRTYDAAGRMHQAVNNAEDRVRTTELSGRIQTVLENLPPQCRLIFVKSRMENKRYATIAMEMGISVKTVEAQMGKALKIFRDKLKNYL